MNIHGSELVDLSFLGYQLLAIVTADTDVAAIERQAREENMFTVCTAHGSGYTYVWGREEQTSGVGAN